MKRISILVLLMFCLRGEGQNNLQKNELPRFNILLINGSNFSYKDLQEGKPLLLVYFAPDCDHCRNFIRKLQSRMKDFSTTQIVLVSYFPLEALRKFSNEFTLGQFPNIKVGTEGGSFFIPSYFKIIKFPFIAVFNRVGKLSAIFREEPLLENLVTAVKK